MRRVVAAVVVLATAAGIPAGCAPRSSVVPVDSSRLAAADVQGLVSSGCYRCLEAAFAKAAAAGLREQAFESALLLAARSKELGLPHARWIDAARGFLPAAAGWERFIDIVLSIPLDPFSGDRDALMVENAATRRPRPTLEQWRRELTTGPGSSVFRTYLDLALTCGPLLYEERDAAADTALGRHPDAALLEYRVGICGRPAMLADLLTRRPDFADVEFELGRAALQRERADQDEALRRFGAALAAFPASPTIASAIGSVRQDREEWAEALEAYDRALAAVPTHRDALLGRTVSLSRLARHADAIASATALIELGSWFISDAYYWRAWNSYQTDDIVAARADVDRSKAGFRSPAALLLSGVIAWREKQVAFAETEFDAALAADFGYCEAALYLGEARAERRRWQDSLAAFQHAEQCFTLAIETGTTAIEQLSATEADARTNARQIASHQRTVADAERRRTSAVQRSSSIRSQVKSTR
jgi:tetratricopeptide (TPR) repeat protein